MRHTIVLIFFTAFSYLALGQQMHLDRMAIRTYKLKIIKEWKVNINKNEIREDSSVITYFYDTSGFLIERKFGYSSVKYVYNEKGFLIDSIILEDDVWPKTAVIERRSRVDSIELIEYELFRIKSITRRWKNGETEELLFNYGRAYWKNDTDILYFTSDTERKFFRGMEFIKSKDCYWCRKDKEGNVYRNMYSLDFIDNITIKQNNNVIREIRHEYEFY